MRPMRFPSIRAVASELRGLSANFDGPCDVRLQVYPDGVWAIRYGDPGYHSDHTGYWGAGEVPGVDPKGRVTRFNTYDLARDLIDQAREQHAQDIDE